jgi:hypothetical protein
LTAHTDPYRSRWRAVLGDDRRHEICQMVIFVREHAGRRIADMTVGEIAIIADPIGCGLTRFIVGKLG